MKIMELTVGGFMVAGIVSLLVLALQVSGLGTLFEHNSGYIVNADFANVGGLKIRSKVSLAGVVVGRVIKIKLNPETYNATVTMILDPKKVPTLPDDSHASILTSGLLGDNYIGLSPGFSEIVLKEGDIIPVTSTDSAFLLEQLISKFVAGQASGQGQIDDKIPTPDSEHKP